TNTELPTAEIALKYKQLWMVEQLFRTTKSLLATRPIFHTRDDHPGTGFLPGAPEQVLLQPAQPCPPDTAPADRWPASPPTRLRSGSLGDPSSPRLAVLPLDAREGVSAVLPASQPRVATAVVTPCRFG
ncbi:MAG: hypothetical protein ACREXM_20930, partial [Gammaproteobacteria bacterium]